MRIRQRLQAPVHRIGETMSTSRLPTLFIPHGGGPCFFMDWDPPDAWARQAEFLRQLPHRIGSTPRALLVISAHWEENDFTVQTSPAPDLVFDYYGFPPHTYELRWPAPGDPALARRVAALLGAAGFAVAENPRRGFDHGVFVPLKVAWPEPTIPTVQLSLRADLDPAAHLAAGRALEVLRDEGVLIIGSGNSYHNLRVMLDARRRAGGPVAGEDFDRWLTQAATCQDPEQRDSLLLRWAEAPGAREANPREEHLLPLHVAAGAAGTDQGIKILEDRVLGVVESAFLFGQEFQPEPAIRAAS
jgi:aromatic ring-opening dioxygenase catalytic subunit (LigB family)